MGDAIGKAVVCFLCVLLTAKSAANQRKVFIGAYKRPPDNINALLTTST